jgi:low temperature requirement protein LtrA
LNHRAMEAHAEPEEKVSPLELFFDLVFVFAFTQVTGLMSENTTWEGVGQGMLILAAIWWAWAAYAWLTNEIDPDEMAARFVVFGSMAAMLVAGLAIPEAFGDDGVLFGVAYFVVRVLHIFCFAYATEDVSVLQAVRRLAVTAIPAPALLIAAGFADGTAQTLLWCAALAIDWSGPFVLGVEGYRLSPSHFAERFGLIVIIALGESIVAIGIGAQGLALDGGEIVAAVAGVAVAGALWWTYFDVVAIVAERKLREARDLARNKLARDSYAVLHLPMIAGIVLLALGIKKTLGDVDDPLKTVPAVALCGGVALYLLAHIAFRWRNVHSINRPRLAVALACAAMIALATEVDAVIALLAVASLLTALVSYEVVAYREARARVRATAH